MDEARRHGDEARPGRLMRLVAAGLAGEGFDVRLPEHAEERRLLFSCRDAECTLTVSDWGETELEYSPRRAEGADPGRLADMASILLACPPARASIPRDGHGHGGLTLKSIVGMELRARGMAVSLDVCEDEANLDVYAEIVATRQGRPDAGQVRVTDCGNVTWQRDHWSADAMPVAEAADGAAGQRETALEIATTVAGAMRQGIPGVHERQDARAKPGCGSAPGGKA